MERFPRASIRMSDQFLPEIGADRSLTPGPRGREAATEVPSTGPFFSVQSTIPPV